MIVAVDAGVLLHLLNPDLPAPIDPETGERPTDCAARVEHLIDRISRVGGRLVIPTPALSEILVKAGAAGPDLLARLAGKKSIRVASFDEMAAVECAALAGGRAARGRTSPRPKAKFDEQIVAIAVVEACEEIVSDDGDMLRLAPSGMKVTRLAELPLPPVSAQQSFELRAPEPGHD